MTTLAQVDISQAIERGLTSVVAFVPKLLAFIAIVVIGWFVARVLQRVVVSVLERIGFDRAVERGGVKQALARTDYDPSALLAKLVFYAVMLFVLQLAVGVFGPNPISALLFGLIAFLPKIFVAIIIVVLAAAIAAVVRELVDAAIGARSYGPMLANAAAAIIVVIGVFAALDQVEIAPAIVNGVFYALLATVVGVTIVAVGGGGVQPMRQRWETALARLDDESSRIREEAATTSAEDATQQVREKIGQLDAADEHDTTAELPTASAGAGAASAPPDSAPVSPEQATEDEQPTASQLREKLEEAGWPTFDDSR